jgi:hypothetical protein
MPFGSRPYKDYQTSELQNMEIRLRADRENQREFRQVQQELRLRYENKARNGTFQ